MFDPATMAMLLKVGLPIAMQAFSALSNKSKGNGTGNPVTNLAGSGLAAALRLNSPSIASTVAPAAGASMMVDPGAAAGAAAGAAGGAAGGMGTLGSIGSALGGAQGIGSALGSMLAGGFGGGGGDAGPTTSTTTSTTDNIPYIFGKTRDKWLGAVGVNRAQQQARNQMVMGMPLFAKDMLGNFLSGSAWGRTLGGGMEGYTPRDPFKQIDPYPLAKYSKDTNGANAAEIAAYGASQPGTYMPQSDAWDEYYASLKEPEGKMWGGPILKTKKYTVGEAGPETYLPPMGGQMRTLGGQGQTVNTLQRGGYVVPNPNTMLGAGNQNPLSAGLDKFGRPAASVAMSNSLSSAGIRTMDPPDPPNWQRTVDGIRPGLGAGKNEKGAKNPTGNTLLPNPALATQGANNALAGTGASILPDPITRNAFSPSIIQQMTARGIEGANMQTRNRNALYAGQMNAAGLTGPNIGAVLSHPSSMDAMRAGAQAATDTQLSGMSMGLNQQQLANQYYLQMLQMLLGGMMGSELALSPSGSVTHSDSTTKMG